MQINYNHAEACAWLLQDAHRKKEQDSSGVTLAGRAHQPRPMILELVGQGTTEGKAMCLLS